MKRTVLCLVTMAITLGLFMSYVGMFKSSPRPPAPPFEGTITGKEWVPASSSTDFITIYQGDGITTLVPITTYHAEEWLLYIGKRKCRVTKEVFKEVEIGKYWSETGNP